MQFPAQSSYVLALNYHYSIDNSIGEHLKNFTSARTRPTTSYKVNFHPSLTQKKKRSELSCKSISVGLLKPFLIHTSINWPCAKLGHRECEESRMRKIEKLQMATLKLPSIHFSLSAYYVRIKNAVDTILCFLLLPASAPCTHSILFRYSTLPDRVIYERTK